MMFENCPKVGCGFSTEGRTTRQIRARMQMHLQRQDHAPYLKRYMEQAPAKKEMF